MYCRIFVTCLNKFFCFQAAVISNQRTRLKEFSTWWNHSLQYSTAYPVWASTNAVEASSWGSLIILALCITPVFTPATRFCCLESVFLTWNSIWSQTSPYNIFRCSTGLCPIKGCHLSGYEKNAYIKLNPLDFDINLHNIKSVCSSTTITLTTITITTITTITLSFDFIFVGWTQENMYFIMIFPFEANPC